METVGNNTKISMKTKNIQHIVKSVLLIVAGAATIHGLSTLEASPANDKSTSCGISGPDGIHIFHCYPWQGNPSANNRCPARNPTCMPSSSACGTMNGTEAGCDKSPEDPQE